VDKQALTMTKSRQAYITLREMIITGQFGPENTWSLRKLATKFKMSVVPITEALRRLEQEGIIEVRPQRGITVRQLSIQELEEVRLMRESLEVQAARLVAIHQPKDKIRKIREKAQEIQELSKAGKHPEMVIADLQMHQELVEASSCPLLVERYDQLITLSLITTGTWNSTSWITHELRGSSNHMLLVEAIESGDPDVADRAIRNHIRTGADRIKE
jgi:DNA-binding GntR family transcriptional regulator